MTIDEAISHAREVAECQKMSARLIEDNAYIPESVDKVAITYGNTICANEHEQLAEWLEELKQYRAIGTPEECRAAVERNNEKTRIIDGITECCGYDFGIDAFQRELSKFCPVCGMKIERSDEE